MNEHVHAQNLNQNHKVLGERRLDEGVESTTREVWRRGQKIKRHHFQEMYYIDISSEDLQTNAKNCKVEEDNSPLKHAFL